MSGFQQFGFGSNDDSIGRKSKKFKAEQGKTYRISFAWWEVADGKLDVDAPTPKFVGAQRHYKEGVGYFLNKGPEYTRIAGEPPKQVIGTLIIVWPTDAKGEPDKARLANGDFEVMPWIFSADKYKQFGQIHAEFPMGHHDLKVTCTDTQYQKMSFAPCKESILRKFLENPKAKTRTDEIVSRVVDLSNSLANEIARDLSIDEIQEKLAGGVSVGSFSKKPSGGASGGGSASTDNIDDLVDGLLSG